MNLNDCLREAYDQKKISEKAYKNLSKKIGEAEAQAKLEANGFPSPEALIAAADKMYKEAGAELKTKKYQALKQQNAFAKVRQVADTSHYLEYGNKVSAKNDAEDNAIRALNSLLVKDYSRSFGWSSAQDIIVSETRLNKAEISKAVADVLRKKDEITQSDLTLALSNPTAKIPAEAKAWGKTVRKVLDDIHERLRKAGADIGYVENWTPQSHNAIRIAEAGKDKWVNRSFELMNTPTARAKMLDHETGAVLSDEKLRAILSRSYDKFTNGGEYGVASTKTGAGVGSSTANNYSDSRIFHFDPENQILYNQEFGNGTMIEQINRYIEKATRDYVLMEQFGPNVRRTQEYMKEIIKEKTLKAKGQITDTKATDLLDANFNMVTGIKSLPSDSRLAAVFQTGRRFESASRLVGSLLSSIPGDIFGTMNIHSFSKTGPFKFVGNYLKMVSQISKHDIQLAKDLGYMQHDMFSYLNKAFVGENDDMPTNANWIQRYANWQSTATQVLTGVEYHTRIVDAADKMTTARVIGGAIGKQTWDKLSEIRRMLLQEAGITKETWELFDGSKDAATTDGAFDPFKAREYLESKGVDNAAEISGKLHQSIITKPGVITRTNTTDRIIGKHQSGTVPGELLRSFFQFKSFPIEYGNMILGMARNPAYGGLGRKFWFVAGAMGAGLAGYYAQEQLKSIAKFETPTDPVTFYTSDPKRYGVALLSAAPFLAQFVKDTFDLTTGDSYYQPVVRGISLVTGPLPGEVLQFGVNASDATGLTAITSDKNSTASAPAKVVNQAIDFAVPQTNYWYVRSLLDRLAFDYVNQTIDPNFNKTVRKRETKIKEESRRSFWRPSGS